MGRKKGFKAPKDPFDALPEEFKEATAAMQADEVAKKISELTMDEERNQAAQRADADLAAKRKEVQTASRTYREQTKLYKLKIKFITRVQSDRGNAVASEIVSLNVASKELSSR